LPDKKKRLDGADLVLAIFEDDKKIIETVSQGGADQLVEAMVLTLVAKRLLPRLAVVQLRLGDERSKASRNPDGGVR